MSAFLSFNIEPHALKQVNHFFAGNLRNLAQSATSTLA